MERDVNKTTVDVGRWFVEEGVETRDGVFLKGQAHEKTKVINYLHCLTHGLDQPMVSYRV